MLIGITGPAGAGKDTAADYLVANYGYIKRSFAGPLKRMMAAAGWPEPANREDKEKSIPGFSFSWREAAQKLGTEYGRGLDSDVWVKIMQREIFDTPSIQFVLPDVRFENEARMIRDSGGILLFMQGRKVELGEQAEHVSEQGVRFYPNLDRDILVDNRSTVADLYKQISNLMALRRKL